MSDAELHRRAERFVVRALTRAGLRAEASPPGLGPSLLVSGPSGRSTIVRVLVREGPHLRGGGANLGMHWMLGPTEAKEIALVDLARKRGWLISARQFRRRARLVTGGRYHLDWIVARLGRTRTTIADEDEFASHAFERALSTLARRLG